MRFPILLIIALLFVTCSRPGTVGQQPQEPEFNATILIGYTGGWGGGPAYKLADGQLFESVNKHNPGNADATANQEFIVLKSITGLQAMIDLADDFDEDVVTDIPPAFDCPEMAYDGACPYFIIVEDNNVRGWTLSEKGTYSVDFKDFMEQAGEALTKM